MRITEKEYLDALKIVKDYKNQIEIETHEVIDNNVLNINIKEFLNPLGCGAIATFIDQSDKDFRFERFKGYHQWDIKKDIRVSDLLKITKSELMRLRLFGNKSFKEIESYLKSKNLELKSI